MTKGISRRSVLQGSLAAGAGFGRTRVDNGARQRRPLAM